MKNYRVLMVGSAEQSGGGVASVIRLMKAMPFWEKYQCGWLGTQIQRNYAWKLWFALKAYFKALLTIWRYDIIHFHTVPDRICLVIQMPVFLLALIGRKKTVMHIHMGNQLEDHTENKLFIWCMKRSNRIVLLAKKWQNLFESLFPTVKVPTAVIYNACEAVSDCDISKKEKGIIMAAYLNENKAPDLLLKAWAKIRNKYPDWKITIMGNGEVEHFQNMAHRMELDNCVSFPGYITGDSKDRYWQKASIYCMCSYNEGFPMVVLEAWAQGIAVITTPVGGLPDVITDGYNCLMFPFGDAEALALRLETLIESESLRHQLAENGQELIKSTFSKEKINTQIVSLYNQLLL